MTLSLIGDKMASMSGLRSIMEDVATSIAESGGAEWLNLSIGNPALIPEVVAMWRQLTEQATAAGFAEASCSYGPSRGASPLVQAIVDYFNQRYGWEIGADNVVVGPGVQMLCFIAAALYAGPGASRATRIVLPMVPDYTGYQSLCMRPDGIAGIDPVIVAEPGRSFRYAFDMQAAGERDDTGLLLLSSPCNPTGRCVDAGELESLTAMAERLGVPLLIDHAYGEPFPQIGRTLVPPLLHPNVINCFSLSKAGLPGERIGFAVGPEPFITPMVAFLSNSAVHASRLAQGAVAAALATGTIDRMVSSVIRPFYAARRRVTESLLLDCLPAPVDWRVHAAESGMFAWLWVNEDWFDDLDLYRLLKRKRVFVAPGRSFFTGTLRPPLSQHATRCFRITLSVDFDVLAEGIRRIAEAIEELRTHQGAKRELLSI